MRIKLIFILLSASGLTTAFSQNTVWNQRSGLLTDTEFSNSICTFNDKIIFANSIDPYNVTSEGTNIFEFDLNGCIQTNYNIPEPPNTESLSLRELISTSDGGFIFTGGMYIDEGSFFNLIIFKLDQHYTVEWWRHFGGIDTDVGEDIAEVSDGYIVVGYTYSYSSNVTNDSYLIKVDKQGNLMQERVISIVPGEMNGHSQIINWNLDTILISGGEKDYDGGEVIDYFSVIKYDKDLVALDSARYQVIEMNTGGGWMLKTSDGKLVINCVRRYEDFVTDVWIAKVDADLDVIYWEDYIDINWEYDLCQAFAELSNGDLIFVGYTDADEGSGPIIYQAWMAKYTQYGQHLWTKVFENEGNIQGSIFWDIKANSDDEIYIAGSRYTFDTFTEFGVNIYNSDPWYIRMDTAGNIYKPLSLHHSFIDDTLTINQPYFLPPYQAINGSPCYNYIWVVQDPDGFALSGPGEDNLFTPTKLGRYGFTLIVQDEGGEQVSTQFELWVEPLTGFEAIDGSDVGLSITNPAGDRLWVANSSTEAYSLILYDLTGREMAQMANMGYGSHSYDSSGWPSGTYLLSMADGSGRRVALKKVIKL